MATKADYERLGAWAVMLNQDANIDRHGRSRTVPMQVLSLGASRTGTMSMQEALTILDYPTYHYCSIFANVMDADMWIEALDVKFKHQGGLVWKQHFDQLLGDYSAISDVPSILFWRELLDAYPDAKVVLVERDEERWAKSFAIAVDGVLNPFGIYVLRFTDPLWFGRIINCGRAWIRALTGSTNSTKAKTNALEAYRKHYADIRKTVPKEKILEYELGSGWEPLCKFLGKEVPSVPFPHRNEAATLENAFGAAIARALRNSLFNVAGVVGVCAVVGAAVKRYAF